VTATTTAVDDDGDRRVLITGRGGYIQTSHVYRAPTPRGILPGTAGRSGRWRRPRRPATLPGHTDRARRGRGERGHTPPTNRSVYAGGGESVGLMAAGRSEIVTVRTRSHCGGVGEHLGARELSAGAEHTRPGHTGGTLPPRESIPRPRTGSCTRERAREPVGLVVGGDRRPRAVYSSPRSGSSSSPRGTGRRPATLAAGHWGRTLPPWVCMSRLRTGRIRGGAGESTRESVGLVVGGRPEIVTVRLREHNKPEPTR
jgi:hypothetical protein